MLGEHSATLELGQVVFVLVLVLVTCTYQMMGAGGHLCIYVWSRGVKLSDLRCDFKLQILVILPSDIMSSSITMESVPVRAVPARLSLETLALARLLGAPAFHVVELSRGPQLRVFHGSAQPRPRLRLHNHFISEHNNQYATSIKIFYLPVLQEVNYSHSLTHTWPHHPSPDRQ
jgi:hypothetical protein